MKFTYHPKANVAYIQLKQKDEEVESIKISDELVIDVSPDGTVYGIELLNANEQLQRGEGGKLVFINELTGKRHEFVLNS